MANAVVSGAADLGGTSAHAASLAGSTAETSQNARGGTITNGVEQRSGRFTAGGYLEAIPPGPRIVSAMIGGRVASDNHDVYEDGLFIPLVKLYDAGEPNEAVLQLIRYNVRTPDEVVGDIRSQIAANHVCAAAVRHLLVDQDMDDLDV